MIKRFKPLVLILSIGWLGGWFSHAFMQEEAVKAPSTTKAQTQSSTISTPHPSATTEPDTNRQAQNSETITMSKTNRIETKTIIHNPASLTLQKFSMLLQQGDYSSALSHWPEQHQKEARNQVFQIANMRSQQGYLQSTLLLLNQYREKFPDDIEAVFLHAKILHQQEQFEREAFLLMELQKQSADPAIISRLNHHLNRAVQAEKEQLLQAGAFKQMLNFYRHMSNTDGANSDYQIMQAIALIEMGNTEQASIILQPLVFDAVASKKAKALLKKIEQIHNADYQITIPLQRSGEHFLVPLSVNGKAPVLLLLDTGASITLMQAFTPPQTSTNHPQTTITLQTANGKMDVPLINSNRIKLGIFELEHIKIALITQPVAARAQGLLGMNILKHFDFFIDQQTPSLKLSPRTTSIHKNNL